MARPRELRFDGGERVPVNGWDGRAFTKLTKTSDGVHRVALLAKVTPVT